MSLMSTTSITDQHDSFFIHSLLNPAQVTSWTLDYDPN